MMENFNDIKYAFLFCCRCLIYLNTRRQYGICSIAICYFIIYYYCPMSDHVLWWYKELKMQEIKKLIKSTGFISKAWKICNYYTTSGGACVTLVWCKAYVRASSFLSVFLKAQVMFWKKLPILSAWIKHKTPFYRLQTKE